MIAPRNEQQSYERRPIDDETVIVTPGRSIRQIVKQATQRASDPLFGPRPRLRKNFVTHW